MNEIDLQDADSQRFREVLDAMQKRAYLMVRGTYKRETLEIGFGAENVKRWEGE